MIWPERIHPNGFHSHRLDAEQPEARFNQRPTAMAASTSTSTPTSISVTQSSLMELSKNLTMRDKTAKIIRFLSPLSPFLLLSSSLYPHREPVLPLSLTMYHYHSSLCLFLSYLSLSPSSRYFFYLSLFPYRSLILILIILSFYLSPSLSHISISPFCHFITLCLFFMM